MWKFQVIITKHNKNSLNLHQTPACSDLGLWFHKSPRQLNAHRKGRNTIFELRERNCVHQCGKWCYLSHLKFSTGHHYNLESNKTVRYTCIKKSWVHPIILPPKHECVKTPCYNKRVVPLCCTPKASSSSPVLCGEGDPE